MSKENIKQKIWFKGTIEIQPSDTCFHDIKIKMSLFFIDTQKDIWKIDIDAIDKQVYCPWILSKEVADKLLS